MVMVLMVMFDPFRKCSSNGGGLHRSCSDPLNRAVTMGLV